MVFEIRRILGGFFETTPSNCKNDKARCLLLPPTATKSTCGRHCPIPIRFSFAHSAKREKPKKLNFCTITRELQKTLGRTHEGCRSEHALQVINCSRWPRCLISIINGCNIFELDMHCAGDRLKNESLPLLNDVSTGGSYTSRSFAAATPSAAVKGLV